MTHDNILKAINDIFIDVLDDDTIVLTDATTANDIEDWDSLNHIQLIVAIEKYFKVRFKSAEINGWKNIGDICTSVANQMLGTDA